jgi:hypothetical protein
MSCVTIRTLYPHLGPLQGTLLLSSVQLYSWLLLYLVFLLPRLEYKTLMYVCVSFIKSMTLLLYYINLQ